MATQPLAAPRGLVLQLEERIDESVVHCSGTITAENCEVFNSKIRELIPQSRGHATAITCRIVLDLSRVTRIDSTGLGALLGAWTAAQKRSCELEIANINPRVQNVVDATKLDTVFKKLRDIFQ